MWIGWEDMKEKTFRFILELIHAPTLVLGAKCLPASHDCVNTSGVEKPSQARLN